MHHVFGAYALYPDRAELVGPDGPVRMEPKAFAVLRLLVEHHERVVSRDEMIEVVWGGRFISDAAVSTALKFARKAVGDDGDRQAMIRGMVERLAEKLAASPHDADGWLRLIRSRMVLRQPDLAREALQKAVAEFSGDAVTSEVIAASARELGIAAD